MKGEIAVEVQRLMNRLNELETEKSDVLVKVRAEDLQSLKEKLGGRCVQMVVDDIRKAIDDDIKHIQKKLNEFIGCREYEVESKLRQSMCRLVTDVFNKQFGGYDNLSYEQRIIIGKMIDDNVLETIKRLK